VPQLSQTYDVIVIGGGFLGLSSAYELAKQGAQVLLLEAGDIGSGTSASCSGRAQVCEGHLDPLNIQLIVDGLKKHEVLEKELGQTYDWRKIGLFLIIRTQSSWDYWQKRAVTLTMQGIPTQVVDQKTLQTAEPNMNTNGLLGAVHTVEGMINPLKFSLAYAAAARKKGAVIQGQSRVTGFEMNNNRVVAVQTQNARYPCEKVAVMTGAMVSETLKLAGLTLPVHYTHAEAVVTEPIPPKIFNNIEISDFYETIHGKQRAVAIGVHPDLHGSIDISEAVTETDHFHKNVSAWGITALAKALIELYPFMAKVRVIRSWGRPTSFTPDEEPIIGWMPQLQNVFVATSLVETITAVPILSEWMAMMMLDKKPPTSLDQFAPSRFVR
jgi:glycine/D-amino acid oxidase-like deaminating enzyme